MGRLEIGKFFNGKRVAITGANGFIGSWLTEELVKNNADVTILLDKDCKIGLNSISHMSRSLDIIYGDILDYNKTEELVKDKDVIFHLAAITQVIYANKMPIKTFEVNANGTLRILEAIRNVNPNLFLVFTSTDKVYGEPKKLPIYEDDPLVGKSPYDASKLAADRLVYSYYLTYGIRCSILRCSNVIGGRDSNILRIVPSTIISLLNNEIPIIRGNGEQIRDYMYVNDAVNGILLAGKNQNVSNGEVFNLGTESPTSVFDLVMQIINMMKISGIKNPVILGNKTEGEIDQEYLNSKKASNILGWRPRYALKNSLEETIKWYSNNIWWQDIMKSVHEYYKGK